VSGAKEFRVRDRVGVSVVPEWALGRRYVALVSRLLLLALALLPDTALAHVDFSAGKSAEQLFDSDCSGCHRSPQALAHGRNAHALTDFLREHYTTKAQSATLLATYITRPVPPKPVVHPTKNSFLKIIRTIWQKLSTISWQLLGALARLLRV
jgi:hypothetical protein